MKKRLYTVFVVLSLLLVTVVAALVIDHLHAKKETGYPSGTVQVESVYWSGVLYVYYAGDDDHTNELPGDYRKIGEIGEIDNRDYPDADWEASRLRTGLSVYAREDGEADHLFVFLEDPAIYHRLIPKQN